MIVYSVQTGRRGDGVGSSVCMGAAGKGLWLTQQYIIYGDVQSDAQYSRLTLITCCSTHSGVIEIQRSGLF